MASTRLNEAGIAGPSSAARAAAAGAPFIERVDLLVKLISHQLGAPSPEIDGIGGAVGDESAPWPMKMAMVSGLWPN